MKSLRETVYPILSCLFAALICVGAFIAVPIPGTPVLIVLQNMFVMLSALVLGPLWGTAAVVLYLFLGFLGLPVFSGGTGGIARFWGPTGGFLFGYVPASLCIGLISRAGRFSWWKATIALLVGSVVHYAIGLPFLAGAVKVSFSKAFAIGCLPFLPGDAVKILIAVPVATAIKPWLEERLGKEGAGV